MLCPITSLHIHKLFVCFFMHRVYSMRAIQTFCVHLLLFRYLLLSCSIVLFGLTTTRLNKTTTTNTQRVETFRNISLPVCTLVIL